MTRTGEAGLVAGVDTHLDAHTVALCDERGRAEAGLQVPATAAGYAQLLDWAPGAEHHHRCGPVLPEDGLADPAPGPGTDGLLALGLGLPAPLPATDHGDDRRKRPRCPRSGCSAVPVWSAVCRRTRGDTGRSCRGQPAARPRKLTAEVMALPARRRRSSACPGTRLPWKKMSRGQGRLSGCGGRNRLGTGHAGTSSTWKSWPARTRLASARSLSILSFGIERQVSAPGSAACSTGSGPCASS